MAALHSTVKNAKKKDPTTTANRAGLIVRPAAGDSPPALVSGAGDVTSLTVPRS
jgi:hypothetical protein